MKKLFTLLFALMVGVGMMYAETYSGNCGAELDGSNLQWSLDTETGLLLISGSGAMADMDTLTLPWYAYNESVRAIRIDEGVTSIGINAFYKCSNTTDVSMSGSVTSIGSYSFAYCSALTSVTVGDGVTFIGDCAFAYCSELTDIVIPASVTDIGWWSEEEHHVNERGGSFRGCDKLENVYISDLAAWCNISFSMSVSNPLWEAEHLFINGVEVSDLVIPDGVTSIGDYAFCGFKGLTSVSIPARVTNIGDYTFSGCTNLPVVDNIRYADTYLVGVVDKSLSGYTIKDGTRWIGYQAFYNCSNMTSVSIPSSVTDICTYAFAYCEKLTGIVIPDGVTSLGGNVFWNCKALASVSLPNSLTGIGGSTFYNCTSLSSISLPENIIGVSGYMFQNCSTLTQITIPERVTSIGQWAFYGCNKLSSIRFECATPPAIGTKAFYNVPSGASVQVPCGSLTAYKSVLDFSKVSTFGDEIAIVVELRSADDTKGRVDYVTTPDCSGQIFIEATAADESYRFVQWSDGINDNPRSVTLFQDTVLIAEFEDAKCLIASGTCGENLTWELSCDSVLTVSGDGEMAYSQWSEYSSFIKVVHIKEGVTGICDFAFSGCSSLTLIEIPNSVTYIGSSAFSGCSGLTTLTIGNKVTNIGERAFGGCSNLSSVVLPETIKKIGNQAFINCAQLSSITLGNSLDSIGEWAFAYCTNLMSIEIPNSVTTIGDNAFMDIWNVVYSGEATGSPWGAKYRNCFINGILLYNDESMTKVIACHPSAIGEVTIPNTVVTIADYAFERLTGLTSIAFGSALDSIGKAAFSGCAELMDVTIPEHVSYMGWGAFNNCDKLPVYDNIRYADTYMVEPIDKSLSTYSIKDGTKWIGGFDKCENMTAIDIPNSAVSILAGAFERCYSLTSINIPDGVLEIGPEAFLHDTNLINVTLSKSLNATGEFAFARCSHLVSIVIPNGIKVISRGCFDGSGLQTLTLPSSVVVIEDMGLAGCSSLESLTSEARVPPTCGKYAFDEIDPSIPVYVPAESVEAYKAAEGWKEFTNIQPIQAEEVPVTEIEAEPTENSVVIEWPKVDEATVYTIEIKKNGELICTLTFNELGQLQGITFAKPSRNGGRNSQVRMAIQTATGWQYTISGLDPDTEYTYSVVAKKNASDTETLYSESISFTTKQTPTGVDEVTDQPSEVRKLLRNGQFYIFRDGKLFNAQGARVK